MKAGITPVITDTHGFLYSAGSQELFIPVRNNGVLVGWVVRCFAEDGRKYDTITEDSSKFFGFYPSSGKKIVIVEDVLSALRVAPICDSITVLGVFLKPEALSVIANSGYEEAVIFLDGDNSQVKMAARRMATRLSPFLRTRIIETGKDPKLHTDEELRCLILT